MLSRRTSFKLFSAGSWRPTLDLVALVSVSTSIFLFIHTQTLTAKINKIQNGLEDQIQKGSGQSASGSGVYSSLLDDVTSSRLLSQNANKDGLNNTKKVSKATLFFNRVPKVGSQTLMDLLQKLAVRNEFQFHRDGTQKVETIKLSYYEESRLTTMIDMFTPPCAYVKHTCFSNFTRHGYDMPIYMNIVRDPIERVISWFYYIRAPWYIIERKQAFPELPLPHPKWLKKDFESCVLDGDRECQFIPGEYHDGVGDHRRQAMFFCGHDERCVEFNGEYAMNKAKSNVEQYYSVVGILEELELSLKVMEEYVPLFFRGAADIYRATNAHVNRNIYKPPVSPRVKEILRKNFTKEIEFYEFCKQRLHLQYLALLKDNKTV